MTQLSAGNRPTAEYQPFRINCNKGPYTDFVGSKVGVEVNGVRMAGLLDTEAQLSLMPRCSVQRILAFNGTNTQLTDNITKAVSAFGHILVLSGTIKAKVQVGSLALQGEFAIADEMLYELLVVRDFLKELGPITVDLQRNAVKVGSQTLLLITANTKIEGSYPKVNYIRVAETAVVPHNAECIVEGSCCLTPDAVYLVESLDRQSGLKVAISLVKAKNNSVPLRLLNPGNSDVQIHKTARVAIAIELGPEEEEPVDRQLKSPCIVSPGKTAKTIPNLAEFGAKFKDLDTTKTVLKEEELAKLLRLLAEYSHIFAEGEHDLGQSNVVQHEITIGNAAPLRSPPHRSAFSNRAVIKQKIAERLRNKIIKPSSSECSSPIALVQKKGGSRRMSVDYTKVNKVTKRDKYPMKRMDDVLASMGKAMIYITLDLQSGYDQVEVSPGDRPKTAFVPYEGLLEYLKMPLGLSKAPATFQGPMERVLAGLDWKTYHVFLDEICIFAPSPEVHRSISSDYNRSSSGSASQD